MLKLFNSNQLIISISGYIIKKEDKIYTFLVF